MDSVHTITALLQTSSSFALDILRGVYLYAQSEPKLKVGTAAGAKALAGSTGGCLVQSDGKRDRIFAAHKRSWGINVSHADGSSYFPRVINDDEKVGEIAADHFLESGFHRFVFLGLPTMAYSEARCSGFKNRLQRKKGGLPFSFASYDKRKVVAATPAQRRKMMGNPPLACFCANDSIAAEIIKLLHTEYKIPDQLAVLGVDNDELQNLGSPCQISSVRLNGVRIGYIATGFLFRLMEEGSPPPESVRIPPVGVVVRSSTKTIAHEDPVMREVLGYIDLHYADAIQVQDLMQLTGLARRTLERKFKRLCGDTLLQRIHSVRIDRAKRLLVFTPHSMEQVAEKTGFGDARQLITTFKRHLGITPGAYRRKHGQGILSEWGRPSSRRPH